MFNLFEKKIQKIVILPTSLLFILLFFITSFILSIPIITITSITLINDAYAEFASADKDSSLAGKSFDYNSSGIVKENLAHIKNQNNSSDKMKELEYASNNPVSSKNQDTNETSSSFNITDSIGITDSITNVAAQPSEVTADFNGDGFSDLAIGVPTEDVRNLIDAGAVNVIYGSSSGLSGTALSQGNGRDDQIWTQDITGGAEPGDRFGSGLATGDFNRDGFSDLAIGVPFEDISTTILDAGAVNVIYGTSGGLSTIFKPSDIWTGNSPGLLDGAQTNDGFGSALATGDINGDGFSDLAIGVPGKGINTQQGVIAHAGLIHVIYGSSNGLNATGAFFNDIWNQEKAHEDPDLETGAEFGDLFGRELAIADFNKDGFSDLVVGVPGEDVGIIRDAGAINVIYGKSDGLSLPLLGRLVWTQDIRSVEGDANINDMFGSALATGDFNKDGISDLAIGTPGEEVGTIRAAGGVNVIYGTSNFGLRDVQVSSGNGRDDQIWTQDSIGIESSPQTDELFGSSLATGDFNKDGSSDLAIGVPFENIGTILEAGVVNVIYGSSDGLSFQNLSPGNGRDDQIWHQNSVGFGGEEIEDDSEANDRFGHALATGDFNKDGISDLAIGVPQESVGNLTAAGAVNVIYGSLGIHINSGGLSTTVPFGGVGRDDQIWTQDSPQIQDNIEANDKFGSSLG